MLYSTFQNNMVSFEHDNTSLSSPAFGCTVLFVTGSCHLYELKETLRVLFQSHLLNTLLNVSSANSTCRAGLQRRNVGSSPIEFTRKEQFKRYENHVPPQPGFVTASRKNLLFEWLPHGSAGASDLAIFSAGYSEKVLALNEWSLSFACRYWYLYTW